MPIAADYQFLDVLWTMILFFCWVAWIWIVITVFIDLFRRDDIGGWGQGGVGRVRDRAALPRRARYLIAQRDGMRKRAMRQAEAQKRQFDQYVREAAGVPRRDRPGQGAARRGDHHPGRVRQDQGQGALVEDQLQPPCGETA
jgi:hypothetical protein